MHIQKDKTQKVRLILHGQKSSNANCIDNLESLHTQQTNPKQSSNQHSSISTSQFSTLFSNKQKAKNNQTLNLFSTLMKPKKSHSKHHHISCHQMNTHVDANKLSTLNLSSKYTKNSSPETLTSESALSKLRKDNSELLARVKSQEKTISDIFEEKRKLLMRFEMSEEKRRGMKEEIKLLKENETQLMTILYVLEEKGIPIEKIIDKWNAENEPSKTNRSLESAAFTPITLDNQPKCLTKIDNIPKLDFNSLNRNSLLRGNEEGDNKAKKHKKKRCNSQK